MTNSVKALSRKSHPGYGRLAAIGSDRRIECSGHRQGTHSVPFAEFRVVLYDLTEKCEIFVRILAEVFRMKPDMVDAAGASGQIHALFDSV